MNTRPGVLARLLGTGLLLFGAAACGEGAVDRDGPLVLGGTRAGACMKKILKKPITFTYGQMRPKNNGDTPLEITKVWLEKPTRMALVDAVVLPGSTVLAIDNTYPPRYPSELTDVWNKRKPAVGATFQPGQELVTMVGVRARNNSYFKAVVIDYKDQDGNRYQARTTTEVMVKPKCPGPV